MRVDREERTFSATYRLMRETAAAILVQDPGTGEETWLPRSQIESIEPSGEGFVDVSMTGWIAKQKGFL